MNRDDISICIITKNECDRLEKCLQNATFLGFEIVVVDTGSKDGTVQMLSKYTDSIFHFEWINDFAAAKNYAAKMARNDIVMILDSDEYICEMTSDDVQNFLKLVETHKDDVGRLHRLNDVKQAGKLTKYHDWTNRVFDRNKFCFSGRIHEQLVRGSVFSGPDDTDSEYATYLTNITMNHDGYVGSDEQVKAKAERNAKLLLVELEKSPEDTYVLYQTGKAYFMMEDYEKAAYYLGKALEYEVEPSYEYVIDLVETYGYALIEIGEANKAVLLESVENEFGNSADFRFMMGLAYMNDTQFEKAVWSFEKATELKNAKMQGIDSYLAWYNAGVIRECLGDIQSAISYYRKCGEYEEAKIRLNEIMPINR